MTAAVVENAMEVAVLKELIRMIPIDKICNTYVSKVAIDCNIRLSCFWDSFESPLFSQLYKIVETYHSTNTSIILQLFDVIHIAQEIFCCDLKLS